MKGPKGKVGMKLAGVQHAEIGPFYTKTNGRVSARGVCTTALVKCFYGVVRSVLFVPNIWLIGKA